MAFMLDPEKAHEAAMKLLTRKLLKAPSFADPALEQTLFGVKFPNPIGLAAGFDKNCAAIESWGQLGFGFAEVGTITFHAQPGSPRPRLFRIPSDQALINRMGFNNDGAWRAAMRLAEAKAEIPIGVNLGKSKITELVDAPTDYQQSFKALHTHGDYFVVNVSSPNTPGLRSLQDKGPLLDILQAMREVNDARPLFVKVSPDLETSALDDVIEVAHTAKLTGLIATNTTIGREGLTADPNEVGGLSGAPLRKRSNEVLAHLARNLDDDKILMGVGGIFSVADAYEKIRLGAHLCQIYTGWIYGGPQLIPTINRELVGLLWNDGFKTIAEARGTGL